MNKMATITYRVGNDIPLDVVRILYRESTLGERRPIDDAGTLEAMMANANHPQAWILAATGPFPSKDRP